jgi:hypothetical protein
MKIEKIIRGDTDMNIWRKIKNVSYGCLMTCLLSLVIVFLFSGNVYTEGGDALFINGKGQVGIGMTDPKHLLDVAGFVSAQDFKLKEGKTESSVKQFLVPRGAIIAWCPGSTIIDSEELKAPPGWVLCDGLNGSPDLRDRFIIGWDNRDPDKDHNNLCEVDAPTSTRTFWRATGGWKGFEPSKRKDVFQVTDINHKHTVKAFRLVYIMKQ